MRLALLLSCLVAACSPSPSPTVASAPPPATTPPAPSARAVPTGEIVAWIHELADLEQAGIGYSPSMTGSQFLPLPTTDEQGMLLLQQTPPSRSPVLQRLVEAGADAVPVLLGCLDDATPTKVPPMKAMMWSAANDEYDYNKRTTPEPRGVNRGSSSQAPEEHRVTVGDLCFVALGQIVNRRFAAVRYQPTGGLMINSPSSSAALRETARAEWSGLTKELLEVSLTRDFEKPDHFFRKESALLRLGYYFPNTAKRLSKTELEKPAFDLDEVRGHVRSLYAADKAKRPGLFRDFVADNGPPGKDGVLQELFADLDRQEAYEQKRVSPATSGSDVRARQCLVELYAYPESVKPADKPYPSYSSRSEQARLPSYK